MMGPNGAKATGMRRSDLAAAGMHGADNGEIATLLGKQRHLQQEQPELSVPTSTAPTRVTSGICERDKGLELVAAPELESGLFGNDSGIWKAAAANDASSASQLAHDCGVNGVNSSLTGGKPTEFELRQQVIPGCSVSGGDGGKSVDATVDKQQAADCFSIPNTTHGSQRDLSAEIRLIARGGERQNDTCCGGKVEIFPNQQASERRQQTLGWLEQLKANRLIGEKRNLCCENVCQLREKLAKHALTTVLQRATSSTLAWLQAYAAPGGEVAPAAAAAANDEGAANSVTSRARGGEDSERVAEADESQQRQSVRAIDLDRSGSRSKLGQPAGFPLEESPPPPQEPVGYEPSAGERTSLHSSQSNKSCLDRSHLGPTPSAFNQPIMDGGGRETTAASAPPEALEFKIETARAAGEVNEITSACEPARRRPPATGQRDNFTIGTGDGGSGPVAVADIVNGPCGRGADALDNNACREYEAGPQQRTAEGNNDSNLIGSVAEAAPPEARAQLPVSRARRKEKLREQRREQQRPVQQQQQTIETRETRAGPQSLSQKLASSIRSELVRSLDSKSLLLGLGLDPALTCKCSMCSRANHCPARLRIVGPVTMRRSCQTSQAVHSLKVIKSNLQANLQASSQSAVASSSRKSQQPSASKTEFQKSSENCLVLAAAAAAAANSQTNQASNNELPISSRSMSLTNEAVVGVASSSRLKQDLCGSSAGTTKLPKLVVQGQQSGQGSSSGDRLSDDQFDEDEELVMRTTRCKANSISSCVTSSQQQQQQQGGSHQHHGSAWLPRASNLNTSASSVRLIQFTTQTRCLLCELNGSRPSSTTKMTSSTAAPQLQQVARKSSPTKPKQQVKEPASAELIDSRNAAKKKDYLKPGDWLFNNTGVKPKRRHSWICR